MRLSVRYHRISGIIKKVLRNADIGKTARTVCPKLMTTIVRKNDGGISVMAMMSPSID